MKQKLSRIFMLALLGAATFTHPAPVRAQLDGFGGIDPSSPVSPGNAFNPLYGTMKGGGDDSDADISRIQRNVENLLHDPQATGRQLAMALEGRSPVIVSHGEAEFLVPARDQLFGPRREELSDSEVEQLTTRMRQLNAEDVRDRLATLGEWLAAAAGLSGAAAGFAALRRRRRENHPSP
jgi:hypothetical protein